MRRRRARTSGAGTATSVRATAVRVAVRAGVVRAGVVAAVPGGLGRAGGGAGRCDPPDAGLLRRGRDGGRGGGGRGGGGRGDRRRGAAARELSGAAAHDAIAERRHRLLRPGPCRGRDGRRQLAPRRQHLRVRHHELREPRAARLARRAGQHHSSLQDGVHRGRGDLPGRQRSSSAARRRRRPRRRCGTAWRRGASRASARRPARTPARVPQSSAGAYVHRIANVSRHLASGRDLTRAPRSSETIATRRACTGA